METTTMTRWHPFSQPALFTYDTASLVRGWGRLHLADCEPLPHDEAVLQAWCHFHNGEFQQACEAGLKAGGAGITAANRAQVVHATMLEPYERPRLQLLLEVAARAEQQAVAEPQNPNAWYWQAYALGRYSQGISVAKALARGLGTRVKEALEKTVALAPRHVDAHMSLGSFHAEVIDKVGPLIGSMTYGVRKDVSLRMFEQVLKLHPRSIIGQIEYARALLMLEGRARTADANRLYAGALESSPIDAAEWLDLAMARAEMQD